MASLDALQNTDLAEEIEAINAIYEPDTITITSTPSATSSKSTSTPNDTATATATATATLDLGSTGSSAPIACTVTLQIPNQANLSLVVGFESSYPETRPHILGTASTGTGSRGEGRVAVDVVEDIVRRTHQPGAVCLFDVINEAIEAFEELNIGGKEEANQAAETATATATTTEEYDNDEEVYGTATDMATLSLRDNFGLDAPPAWVLSDVVNEKKSIFVGRAAAVTSLDQAQAFLDHLLATEKKVAAATHNISAWRIREKRTTTNINTNNDSDDTMIVQDSDDDGETAAGGRLLHLMQLMDVWDVVVVVTRWYGGVHLGPDRFRIINAVGRDALIKGGFSHKETTADKDKDKGKKKKGSKK